MRVALVLAHHFTPHDLQVTVSIGICVFPYDGLDAETLFKNADLALHHAKENGRNNSQFFKPDMNRREVEQRTLETGLRGALERSEFELHYQPKVNLQSGAVSGAEALLRWHHPIRGTLLPALCVSAMINVGKSLHQRVVAEGVETPEELAFLQLHNCDEGQGNHFCRPVCADEFALMLAAGLPNGAMEIATMRLA